MTAEGLREDCYVNGFVSVTLQQSISSHCLHTKHLTNSGAAYSNSAVCQLKAVFCILSSCDSTFSKQSEVNASTTALRAVSVYVP